MLEKSQLEHLAGLLMQTDLGPDLVLVGSAALYLTPVRIPPMTADADFAVDTGRLAANLSAFLADLRRLGFAQVEDTATFMHQSGVSFDLLGLEAPGQGDHVARVGGLRVLVFEDLSRLAVTPGAIRTVNGVGVLAPAALAVSKLMTTRMHKGIKDKVQALAMIGELAKDVDFVRRLGEMMRDLSPADREDVVSDAQAACAGLNEEEARDYAPFVEEVTVGLQVLQRLGHPS